MEINNATGAELHVKSHHHSAFDGLEIVVMDQDGRKRAQQTYTSHQALYSFKARTFSLKEGKNCQELRFPVSSFSRKPKEFHVLLVGTLPGSEYHRTLCSNPVVALVK